MDNSDIYLFTFLVIPSFLVFVFLTVRKFSRVGDADFKQDADTRLK